MLLVTLEPRAVDCRVELDGIDISKRIVALHLAADVRSGGTRVTLTLKDSVVVVGTPGAFEFIDKSKREE